jgi:hypothetical protein
LVVHDPSSRTRVGRVRLGSAKEQRPPRRAGGGARPAFPETKVGRYRDERTAVALGVDRAGGAEPEDDVADLPPEIQDVPQAAATPFGEFPEEGLDLPAYLSSIERDLIQQSLRRTGGNRNKAAELLRIKRTTLVEKLKRLGPD